MTSPLSVVIACPHPLKAQGVTAILREGGHHVRDAATTEESLRNAVAGEKPDIVVVDGCLCGPDMSTIRELSQRGATVVVLAGTEREAAFIRGALKAGARGCLCCDDSADRFLHSLELLARGTIVISREHMEHMAGLVREDEHTPAPAQLTRREQQVAAMVAQGATNKEIAEALYVSEHTVKIHLGNILDKLGLRNRQQLAAYIAREGIIEGALMPGETASFTERR
jgi:DNA-binding NarL/FixJ family response regulator